jgi:hypothetical protein
MACRRCSECQEAEHHWIENPDFGYGEEIDGFAPPEHPDYSHACKHCEALGGQCPECDGDGTVGVPRFESDDTEETCARCKGVGVIEGLACTGWRDEP